SLLWLGGRASGFAPQAFGKAATGGITALARFLIELNGTRLVFHQPLGGIIDVPEVSAAVGAAPVAALLEILHGTYPVCPGGGMLKPHAEFRAAIGNSPVARFLILLHGLLLSGCWIGAVAGAFAGGVAGRTCRIPLVSVG